MRADGPLAVFGHVVAKLSLADEDVEMIFPEIRHHFGELALAGHRTSDLGRQQVVDEFTTGLRATADRHAIRTREHRVAAHTRLRQLYPRRWVVADQLSAAPAQGREGLGQDSIEFAIGKTLRP